MKFFIEKDISSVHKRSFQIVEEQIKYKPGSLLGLAVGKTTDGLYKLVSKDALKNPKKWSKLKLFQIDENLNEPPGSKFSFNREIRKELKSLFKILKKKNIFLIDGTKAPKQTVKKAYSFIRQNGGIDLVILGIGPEYDPHIAYNMTGKSSLNSRMRVVDLHPKIVKKLYSSGKMLQHFPAKGITLGIKDILKARKILLIAFGKKKAKSIKLAFWRKVNMKKSSASALQLHKNTVIVLDKQAKAKP